MGKYEMDIVIQYPNVSISLREKNRKIDFMKWKDKNDMSVKLLAAIDILLKKNRLGIVDLTKVNVVSDCQSYTSTRIAKAVAKTVSCCLA